MDHISQKMFEKIPYRQEPKIAELLIFSHYNALE